MPLTKNTREFFPNLQTLYQYNPEDEMFEDDETPEYPSEENTESATETNADDASSDKPAKQTKKWYY